MRTLTIKRTKSFVGCLGKFKAYIEDPNSNEIVINDVPCRKLGELKNGEEKQFLIGENEAKVYVIAGEMSKAFCNEFYKLPAGTEDIYLSGQSRFNPAAGNAFRFDGQTDLEVLANRKKGTKKGLVVLIIAVLVGLAVGGLVGRAAVKGILSGTEAKEKTFSSCGMEITLTDRFREASYEGLTVCYESANVAVFALQESFDLMEGVEDYTLAQYGQLVLQANQLEQSATLQEKDGLTYFEYQRINPENKITYHYFAVLYKESDAFWMVQFATPVEKKDDYRQDFIDWAKTVKFTQA